MKKTLIAATILAATMFTGCNPANPAGVELIDAVTIDAPAPKGSGFDRSKEQRCYFDTLEQVEAYQSGDPCPQKNGTVLIPAATLDR
jgi:hypothetical protein